LGYRFIAPVTAPAEREAEGETPGPTRSRSPRPFLSLRRTAAFAAPALLLMLVLASWARSPVSGPRPVLAVLPFEEPAAPGVAATLAAELIGRMGRLYGGRMGVIARPSAMSYRGSGKGVAQIGLELGASHILEGSVRSAGSRLRITARLVRVADQIPLWSSD